MSDKLTEIRVLGTVGVGIGDWGKQSVAHMVEMIRAHARHLRAEADAIDATPDDAFEVRVVLGSYLRKELEVLQAGKVKEPATPNLTPSVAGEA